MKIYGDHFYARRLGTTGGEGGGTHQAARRVPGAAPLPGRARHPPGCLVAPPGAPFCLLDPPRAKTPEEELLSRYIAATVRKPNRGENPSSAGDSAGEITSRKG